MTQTRVLPFLLRGGLVNAEECGYTGNQKGRKADEKMREAEAMAVLCAAPKVGWVRREAALAAAGNAQAVLDEPEAYQKQLTDAGVRAIREMMRRGEDRRMLEGMVFDDIRTVLREDEGYPPLLRQAPRPPHLLFVKGSLPREQLTIGVVGTRRASEYGLRQTQRIAGQLAEAGVTIISGMAVGIDTAGHRGALDAGGKTVAVLGGGFSHIYPRENIPLMEEILGSGGSIITEYAPHIAPGRYTFLERNRIIAGMSLGVLVTEGAHRSGALRTAQDAADAGREVFALPGRVDDEGAQLPNRLIGEGAHLICGAEDILRTLVIEPANGGRRAGNERKKRETEPKTADRGERPSGRSEEEERICRVLEAGEADFDAIGEATGIPADALGAMLMMMEMDGVITALPGLRYRLSEG